MVEEPGFQVAGEAPAAYQAEVRHLMAPFVKALVGATVAAGDAVLDVACGTGFATRAAAAVAGPGARVEGSDVNPAMVAQARSVPDDSGAMLTWREASALDLPYAHAEFDAVICQQGLQFFPDPAAGVQEMARVAQRGGRLGVTVWSPADQSPFLDREMAMLARHGGGSQAAFSATEQQLLGWFEDGGVSSVSIERITVDVNLPPVKQFVPLHLKALPWSVGFFDLSDTEQASALHELDGDLGQYKTDAGITVPFSSYLVTATI